MKIDITIESKRLLLRNLVEEDVSENYVNWLNDPDINKYLTSFQETQTFESCIAYVRSYQDDSNRALIGIFDKTNHQHIGNLTLSTIDWRRKSATVGIALGRKEYFGKGLGREALMTLKNYCFQQTILYRLQAGTAETNLASMRTFLECGFKVEGYLKDSEVIDGQFCSTYILGILSNDCKK